MPNQSITRAVSILSLFTLNRPQLSNKAIAKALGLPPSTVHGLVRTLVELGLLEQDTNSKGYRLGLRLNELGAIQMATLEINQRAAVPARYLATRTDFLVHVAVFSRDAIVITYSSAPLTGGPFQPYLGTRAPAYCTSIGRVVLANLPSDRLAAYMDQVELVNYTPNTIVNKDELMKEFQVIREKGYSLVKRELLSNLDNLGAPIFNSGGEIIGGISLNGDFEGMSQAHISELGRKVMDAAQDISEPVEPRAISSYFPVRVRI